MSGTSEIEAGDFDNRSISFPTDFPSANLLLSRNIKRAVLMQLKGNQPQEDLSHTLRKWQESGIKVLVKAIDEPGSAKECDVKKPSKLRGFWYYLLARLGVLTSNHLGGFGRIVSESAGG